MKRGDRRALDRAARKLPIAPGEELLEFDIGSRHLNILPRAFPYPLSNAVKRIDLVASDQALYIHAGGHVLRLGWDEILEFSLSDESFISWLLRNGEKGQVNVGRGPRELATVVNHQLELFETLIGEVERDGRDQLRSKYAERDRRDKERWVVLNRQNQFTRALTVSGVIFRADGTEFVAGTVALRNSGIEFVTNDLMQMIVPYDSIRELTEDENGHAIATLNDEHYVSFSVRVADDLQITEWIDDVEKLKEVDLA